MSATFNKLVTDFLPNMSTFTDFYNAVNTAISKHFPKMCKTVCDFHDVCFCDECCDTYKLNNFSEFLNACEHCDATCAIVGISETKINQLQLLVKFAEHMESLEDLRLLEEPSTADAEML